MSTTPPTPQWNERTKALYAEWFVDCYYYEPEDGQHYARRSDADAYEQWKSVAAALGVWRTQEIHIPDDVSDLIAAGYKARGEPSEPKEGGT